LRNGTETGEAVEGVDENFVERGSAGTRRGVNPKGNRRNFTERDLGGGKT